MKDDLDPGTCGVCGSQTWRVKYEGAIRHGTFGSSVEGTVFECCACGVGFLPSSVGMMREYYAGGQYREVIGEGSGPESFFKLHDAEQLGRYPFLERVPLRGRIVADVGCAAGSFLDGVRGFASTTIAIEPAAAYHESLRHRGHVTFSDLSGACDEWKDKVDVAVCFSVIEHVADPVAFLRQIKALLAPGGQLLLSTPNARDILLEIGCDAYLRFFYRSVHAYYFDSRSLQRAALAAGFTQFEARHVHRFNFANFVEWLGHHQPAGNTHSTTLGARFDRIWKAELEEGGHADYLYAWVSK